MLKIKDHEGLVRDPLSSAVINTDNTSLALYKKNRERERRITQLINDVEMLKRMVKELQDRK